ncbi:Shedu immune nuclease family protein [Salinibacterium sp. NK8237]|uniref:Shedu immune nuclease family protein n=1 Tax=Salinibacterium sp. NK8237 TaxID=2792038 RepID=UPI0018CCAAB9|nr:Shedu immune nuclease family protein [Salinibacterium sp. NK8237]MBH0129353.1 DUF4263 domain-containing protein [Salinibacterium sp. NK8237]
MPTESDFESASDSPFIEAGFAQSRIPGRTYVSKSFENGNPHSKDFGKPSRFVYEVFDDDGAASTLIRTGEEWTVEAGESSRTQIKILISREAGQLVDLWIQRVPAAGVIGPVKEVLRVRRDDAIRMAEFFRRLMLVEPAGASEGTRIDDEMLTQLINDPASIQRVYNSGSDQLRMMVASDANARDIVALEGRRSALTEFRKLLADDSYFDALAQGQVGKEAVWQRFFESNLWVLGIGLGAQLFTSWSDSKLEQVVAGYSIAAVGKRADALLQTNGLIKSLVFAEIKHHRTQLLARPEYRSGVWPPSKELAGGVSQSQVTVHRAVEQIGSRLRKSDENGFETDEVSYLVRPRAFLIAGRLGEFTNEQGGHNSEQITSFELYRRNLHEPEIITFDELLARAEWIVENS